MLFARLAVAALALSTWVTLQAQELIFGMSTALSGPAADLGEDMRTGVLAAFEEANRSGASGGRRLKLVALDDGYEPSRTVPNMHPADR